MIEIKNIHKSYGKQQVLRGVDFVVEPGQIVGILGANGSGKSTLLTILAGLQKCDAGFFNIDGKDMLKNTKLKNQLVAYVPQEMPLITELTAWDNLRMWYSSDRLKKELSSGVLKLLGVDQFIKTPVHQMSGGMKKRLCLGCAMNTNPKLMLLDEPTASLDLECKEKIYDYFERYKDQGGSMIIATHEVQEIELCDKCYIIKDGVLVDYKYDGDIPHLIGRL
ncbi:ABC-2 type transport system ATP-binding protein [Pseudobutyrivibrio sp. OR37]|uniref:heme ABC exporter ATP-binding protein CcmA n=1 Tax=Pseudobutyrivibrio sp. OR37 TaxID=1798186 RepID=UPI0008EBE403|nr:heme ABC exporter ATP-binding protein CcmA [Pseudobutyrivibrio sp. OR37]SFI26253.1 ABC-2 type transport system ATP-binding protein [Pseudobutyrivibrio sp. OR37]